MGRTIAGGHPPLTTDTQMLLHYKPVHYDFLIGRWTNGFNFAYSTYGVLNNVFNNTIYAPLSYFLRRTRVDRIGIYVAGAGAAGAAARLGIYAVDPATFYPTTLLLDAGTVDCTAIGAKQIIVDFTFSKFTWYALAYLSNDATIDVRQRAHSGWTPLAGGGPIATENYGYGVAQAYGALPNPFPAGGAVQQYSFVAVRIHSFLP